MLQGHGGITHASDLRPSHGRTWMWTATAWQSLLRVIQPATRAKFS